MRSMNPKMLAEGVLATMLGFILLIAGGLKVVKSISGGHGLELWNCPHCRYRNRTWGPVCDSCRQNRYVEIPGELPPTNLRWLTRQPATKGQRLVYLMC